MSLKIGRVGLTAPNGDPIRWDQHGNQISVAGYLAANSALGARELRQQLAGYVDNVNEPVVPVIWSEDPTADGYYRVRDTSISSLPSSLYGHLWPMTVDLERVDSYAGASFESTNTAVWTTNAANRASTNAKQWLAVPTTLSDLSVGIQSQYVLGDSAGDLWVSQSTPPNLAAVRWGLPPSNWYQGAVTLYEGLTTPSAITAGRVVVGTQCSADPFGWRLSNGLVRVFLSDGTGGAGTGTPGQLCLQHANQAGTWATTPKSYDIQTTGGIFGFPGWLDAQSMVVLRNTPVEVVIRIKAWTGNTTLSIANTLDISLRRGSRCVSCVWRTSFASTVWVRRADPTETAVAVTYGATANQGAIQAAAADASNLRYVICSPMSWTQNLATGRVDFASANVWTFGIGAVPASGVTTSATEDAATMADRYMTAQGEIIRNVVG